MARILTGLTTRIVGYASIATVAALMACHEGAPLLGLGTHCERPADCIEPFVCDFGRCRVECTRDGDCEGGACVQSLRDSEANVCLLPDEGCPKTACPAQTECAADGVCRSSCEGDSECGEGRECSDGTCRDRELGDAGSTLDGSASDGGRRDAGANAALDAATTDAGPAGCLECPCRLDFSCDDGLQCADGVCRPNDTKWGPHDETNWSIREAFIWNESNWQ